MASSRLINQINFAQDIGRLIRYAAKLGIFMTFGEAYRTKEQQNIHLKSGSTTVKYSKHQDRLAVDFNFFFARNGALELDYNDTRLQDLGEYWEGIRKGNAWGGNWTNFKDSPHFEFNEAKAI